MDGVVPLIRQDNIVDVAFKHFKNAYRYKGLTNIVDQANIMGLFPKIISDREA